MIRFLAPIDLNLPGIMRFDMKHDTIAGQHPRMWVPCTLGWRSFANKSTFSERSGIEGLMMSWWKHIHAVCKLWNHVHRTKYNKCCSNLFCFMWRRARLLKMISQSWSPQGSTMVLIYFPLLQNLAQVLQSFVFRAEEFSIETCGGCQGRSWGIVFCLDNKILWRCFTSPVQDEPVLVSYWLLYGWIWIW